MLVLKAHSLDVCTLLDGSQLHKIPRDGGTSVNNALTSIPGSQATGSTKVKEVKKAQKTKLSLSKVEKSTAPSSDSDDGTLPQPSTDIHMTAVVQTHFFPSTTFRGVSFSRPVVHTAIPTDFPGELNDEGLVPTKVSLSFLAYDVLRGLFHCEVTALIPAPAHNIAFDSAQPPLDVDVRLLAAHNMAIPVAPGAEGPNVASSRSNFSHGARGFVTACTLGPMGRRGVWVERRRGAVRRVVYEIGRAHV